jgi:exopolysaccharide biosynthesis polyprenyl glycosylphosphotransferase
MSSIDPATTRTSRRSAPSAFRRAAAYGLRARPGSESLESVSAPPLTPRAPASNRHHSDVESVALRHVSDRERNYRWSLACADVYAAACSMLLAMVVIGGYSLRPGYAVMIPLVVVVAKLEGLYDHDELVIHKSTLDEFPRLLNLATLIALLTWLGRHSIVTGNPRTALLLALWGFLIVMLFGFRLLARAVAGRYSSVERCLFVGGESVYQRLEAKLTAERRVTLVGSVALADVTRDLGALRSLTEDLGVHRIIISTGGSPDTELTMDVVRGAKATGLRVSILPDVLAAVGSAVAFDDLGGMPLLGVPRFGLGRSSRAAKRTLDLVGASVGLVLLTPVVAVVSALIKADTHGPILFRQTRIGKGGKPFQMLKFRTMVEGADAMKSDLRGQNEASGLFKIADDPRVTRVGRFLRQTSLDEVPQLLNVLRGNMSLVGPRPLVLDEDKRVTGFDRRRLHLTPGVTGRWQTLGSARIPLSEMVKIDYLYVANWSLWADIKILVQTVGFVIRRRGL